MKRKLSFTRIAFVLAASFTIVTIKATAASAVDVNISEKTNSIPKNLIKLRDENPDCEFINKFIENYDVFLDIYKNCNYQFAKGCGSYLFDGLSYEYCEKMYEKQKLLYNTAKKCDSFLEIGVYMGHSIFIVLLANPDIDITCIDISDRFAAPALEVISKKFNKEIDFIVNNSLVALPLLDKKFDMFHIDAIHTSQYLEAEFSHCINKCSKEKIFFVIDDYDSYPDSVDNLLIDNSLYNVIDFNIPICSWRNILINLLLLN